MECAPTERVEVVKVAISDTFKVPVPRVVVPSLKVTVPVGGFAPTVATVAVKVTATPEPDGLRLEMREVVVAEPAAIQATKRLVTSTEPRPATRL
jgi:hypothetical protein